MSLSRRAFVQTVGIGAAGALTSFVSARGRENAMWSAFEPPLHAAENPIILASNENPMGPGEKVLNAVRAAMGATGAPAGRYPFAVEGDLRDAIAAHFKLQPENVLIGTGSTQILRTCTQVYTDPNRPLVGSIPTYEECSGYASTITHAPVRGVKMTADLKLDLEATIAASKGAGLVFFCSPNNPAATAVSGKDTREFIERVNKLSPKTTILVDEAYYDYVTDPSYETMLPIAVQNPRVIVARTFSKAYGMAGLRIGYAIGHPQAIRELANWESGGSITVLALKAALVAIDHDPAYLAAEKARNKAARDFTIKSFADRGIKSTDSQANFL
ncbi:MAG: aminotransferase class I/II-fold pyridoxal phosphate-dependent enzyme, partial [Acidobacteria bacterium]|nr:aminotransferase class I/II-fold pyridoxal phosphate-dependent enzyme [Acidobacteriota bacterium]